jgi:hypothetical protein
VGVGSAPLADFASTCFPFVAFGVLFSSWLSSELRLAGLALLSAGEAWAPFEVAGRCDPVDGTARLAVSAPRNVGSLLVTATPEDENVKRASETAIP